MKLLDKDEAEAAGYATWDPSPHLCVDIPDGGFTITTKDSRRLEPEDRPMITTLLITDGG